MEPWKIESNPIKQTVFTLAIIIVGVVLCYGFRNFDSSGFTNSLAGFLLGVLLLVIGIPALVLVGKKKIIVDPIVRSIVIIDVNRFGKKRRDIHFNEINEVFVGMTGKRSNGTMNYYVVLKLNSGEIYRLFYPAYYDGKWDRSVAESRRRRIQEYLEQNN
jgi:hypothetical protein